VSVCWADWDQLARSALVDAAAVVAVVVAAAAAAAAAAAVAAVAVAAAAAAAVAAVDAVASGLCTAKSVADCYPASWDWVRSADTTETCRIRGSSSDRWNIRKREAE